MNDIDSKLVQKWLGIIAYGRCAKEIGGSKRKQRHLPAYKNAMTLSFHDDFVKKHSTTHGGFMQVFSAKDSAWRQAKSIGATGSTTIRSLEDCRKFLLRARLLPQMAGVQATFLKRSSTTASEKAVAAIGFVPGASTWPKRRRCS